MPFSFSFFWIMICPFLQLSSKCDNRLFRICFSIFGNQMCPFLESCSRPIRCISRNRIIRSPSLIGKKAVHAANLFGGSHPSDVNEVTHDVQHAKLFNNGYMANQEVMHGCAFKRVKIGHDKISTRIYADSIVRCPDEIFHTVCKHPSLLVHFYTCVLI